MTKLVGFNFMFILIILSVFLGVIISIKPFMSIPIVLGILIIMLYVGFFRGILNLYQYIFILIPLIIFSTPIKVASSLPAVRLDDLWLLFGIIIFISKLILKKQQIKVTLNGPIKFFVLFIAWIAFTILLSSFLETNYYSHSDWFEIVKAGKLLVIFLLVMNLKFDEIQVSRLAIAVIVFLCITAIFGVFQYFNIANINAWLSNYYIAETKISGFYDNGRVVGTFGNPNIFAGALIIGVSLVMARLMVKPTIIYTLILSIFIFAIFLTLSRIGLISLIIVLSCITFLSFLRYKKRIRVLMFSIILVPLGLLLLKNAPDKFFMRVGNLNNINGDNSFSARLYNWSHIYRDRTSDNLIAGTGPTGKLMITFDNEWLHLLTYYGLIGVLLFSLIFIMIFLKIKKTEHKDSVWIQIAAQGMVVTFPIYMITSSVFHALQLMPIVIICLALAFRIGIKERTN